MKIQLLALLLSCGLGAIAQSPITLLESGKRISIRGLSVPAGGIVWASGTGGSVARSTDGGKTFTWTKVPGYEKSDFRDIEAFDANTALIVSIMKPAAILKTRDGGLNWRKVFEDTAKDAFFDAMDVRVSRSHDTTVVAIGDPVSGSPVYVISGDAGETWSKPLMHKGAAASFAEGEAFFASSGTNAVITGGKGSKPEWWAASGGKASFLWNMAAGRKYLLPLMQGKESTGANSLAIRSDHKKAVIVGGDFARDTVSRDNCALISFSPGITITLPATFPHGYRSCVTYVTSEMLVACGTSGVDISRDGGMNWQLVSKESFHVCKTGPDGAVFLAGNSGRIGVMRF